MQVFGGYHPPASKVMSTQQLPTGKDGDGPVKHIEGAGNSGHFDIVVVVELSMLVYSVINHSNLLVLTQYAPEG